MYRTLSHRNPIFGETFFARARFRGGSIFHGTAVSFELNHRVEKDGGGGRGAKINYIDVRIGVAGSITKSFCHRSLSVAILSGACLLSSKTSILLSELINLCRYNASNRSCHRLARERGSNIFANF